MADYFMADPKNEKFINGAFGMHGKERFLLLTLSFFFTFLFGCNRRDIVVDITPVSSAIHSEYISSDGGQSFIVSDKTASEKQSSSARTKSMPQSVASINDSSSDKAAAKAELDSLNAYYQQCKRIYQKELSEKKESIAALKKKIQEKESERNEAQEELDIYLLSGKDGLKNAEDALREAILTINTVISDLQQQLDLLTEEQNQLEKSFDAVEQNYFIYKEYLQQKIKSFQ